MSHSPQEIIKRDGRVQPYDRTKIYTAVFNCLREGMHETEAASGAIADEVTEIVEANLMAADIWPVQIEAIQDLVENALMQSGHYEVARAYIRYRHDRERERLAPAGPVVAPELLDELAPLVHRAAQGLTDVDAEGVLREALTAFYPGIGRAEAFTALLLTARTRIEREPNYTYFTARILLEQLYEEALGQPTSVAEMQMAYARHFADYVRKGVAVGRLDPRLLEYDLNRLSQALQPHRDLELNYLSLQTLYDRYLLHEEKQRYELPQWFWMRVAMGVALAERPEDREHWAIQFYELMASKRFCPSTPTLFNAGTVRPQLSSCFITHIQDDLRHIAKSWGDNALMAKFSGGIGNSHSSVRGLNAWINGTNGPGQGTMPFMKVFDDVTIAVDQGGKRLGACAAYLADWHVDVEEFLGARKNTGDERRRLHQMNTALWVSDLFMQRMERDEDWTFFSPDEVPDLPYLYGREFRERYEHYEREAEAGRIRLFRKVRARDIRRAIVSAIYETGHPWLCFKDPANVRSPQDHVGRIMSSNLCTEIEENAGIPFKVPVLFTETYYDGELVPDPRMFFASRGPFDPKKITHQTRMYYRDVMTHFKPTDRELQEWLKDDEVAVCNLGSINVVAHLKEDAGGWWDLDTEQLQETVRLGGRMLDNVIDENLYTIPETRRSNERHRPVGMGIMGLQSALWQMNVDYASEAAIHFNDVLLEHISYYAILANADLAEERGSYPSFEGSKWHRGILPIDSIALLAQERGSPVEMDRRTTLDWDYARRRAMQGQRNSNKLALAPTATIGLIVGVSPVTEPLPYNLYVKSNMSGEFTNVNEYLVTDLKRQGLWDQDMLDDLKYFNGSVQDIDRVPQWIKDKYRTCFEIEPYWVIAAASRRAKWLDQSQSVNLWYRGTSMRAIWEAYQLAWRMGLKSTYYFRTEAKTEVEKSTLDVNKYGVQPRWMKERSASADVVIDREPEVKACRLDDPTCDACQ